jgi:tetratricopeptide (TPR) repeat protein
LNEKIVYLIDDPLDDVVNDKSFILGTVYLKKASFFYKSNQIDNAAIEFSKAIEEYTKVILKYPTSHLVFMARGHAYDSIKKYNEAIVDFDNAIKLFPNPLAYLDRGQAYFSIGNYDIAIESYNNALLLNSEFINSGSFPEYCLNLDLLYNNRGNAYHEKGDLIRAYSDWGLSLQINPKNELLKNNYKKLEEQIAIKYKSEYSTPKANKEYFKNNNIGCLLFFDLEKMSSKGYGFYGKYFYEKLFDYFNTPVSNDFTIWDGDLLTNSNIDILNNKIPDSSENLEVLREAGKYMSHLYIVLIFGSFCEDFSYLNGYIKNNIEGFIGMVDFLLMDLSSYDIIANQLKIPMAMKVKNNEINLFDFLYFNKYDFEKIINNGYIIKNNDGIDFKTENKSKNIESDVKHEVDIMIGREWICGHCNTHNNINIDICTICNKKFGSNGIRVK